MSLRITSQGAASSHIDQTRKRIEKAFEQLSSGKRINRASDDAAALAISEKLNAVERALQAGVRNLQDGVSIARTAEGALAETSNTLTRMRELSVQAGNGALDQNARDAIQKEFDQLAEEITRSSESTRFNGKALLNGEASGAGAVTIRDGGDGDPVVQISVGDHSAQALGVAGLDASDPASLQAIDQALQTVSATRADLGAAENRLEGGVRNLLTEHENVAAANSRIRDADVAKTAAEATRAQILQQLQVSTAAQANISATVALSLLR